MSTALEHLGGKYEILEKLQEGGMGAVYKVRHRLLDEVRVIKVVRPQFKQDEEVKARFLREARTVIRLRHPNIAQLYDFSIDADENAFIVMEFIDGVTFLELLRRAPVLPLPLVLEMARQSLEALRYLHRRGIVHRDIAPDNLMLTRDEDGSPLVKLIDLGVAKVLEGGSHFTVAGTFLGKVRYASPEQFRSQEGVPVEPRSDLYSFGVVLYQLLTGALPVRGSSLSSLIAGHLLEPPVPFSETDPEGRVPADLRDLVLRALAKKPEDRPANAGAFVHAIEAIQERFPLAPGEVDRLLASPDLPTTKLPVVKPGSTQDRLDEQFQLVATALPKERPPWLDPRLQPAADPPDPHPAQAPVAPEETPMKQIQAAEGTPTPVTPLPPPKAPPSHGQSEKPAEALPAPPPLWVEELVSEVENLLEIGDAAGARRLLRQAESDTSEYSAVARLEKQVEESELAERRRRAEALLVEARVAVGMDDPDLACRHLEEVLRLDPDNSEAARLLARANRQEEERRSQRATIAETVARAEAALAAGHLEEAESLADWLASAPQATDEANRLRAAVAEAKTRHRQAQVAQLLRQAREAAESQRFLEAESTLERALELNPEDTLIGNVLASTRRAREEHEQRLRQEQALTSVAQRVEVLLQAEEIEEARAVVEEAASRLGPSDTLAMMQQRIEALAAEAAAWTAARATVAQARELLRAGRSPEALARLEEARFAAAGYPAVLAFVAEEEHLAREQLEGARRQREVEEACRRVAALLGGGNLEEAGRALALAEKLFPRQGKLLLLRQQLNQAATQRRAEACAGLAAQARSLAADGKFELAIRMVEEALRANPDYREACAPLIDELRRGEAMAAVSSCLARGDHAGARRALTLAERMFPGEEQFAVLRRRLEES